MSDKASPIVVWFRTDLRLTDNPALTHAVRTGRPVVPLFVLDEAMEDRPIGAASRWWLDKSLRALAEALEERGSILVLRRGDSAAAVKALVAETGAGGVAWSRIHQRGAAARDNALRAELEAGGVAVRVFAGDLLLDPDAVRTKEGGAYKVFTPFSQAVRKLLPAFEALAAPARISAPARVPAGDRLEDWALHPRHPDWSKGFDWTPGETSALDRLEAFAEDALADYAARRDRPDRTGTSRLSPHLRWGEISPDRVIARARWAGEAGEADDAAAQTFVAEVLWREFNRHILWHAPDLADRPLRPDFGRFPWRKDARAFRAWTRGETGFPIVDAGMRQLWATGWMHNRVRMIAASFLVKDLLIDWREGERWFWDTLVDADPGNNPGNWQWSAGCGADAAPYFRIFNPTTQGERFDPDGDYVRRWVPELGRLPTEYLHAPAEASAEVLAAAGVRLGHSYPHPIVDHRAARERALAALSGLKASDGLSQRAIGGSRGTA